MIRWLIGAVVVVALVIIGISLFLTPDNLMKCNDMPSDLTGCEKADVIIAVSGGDTPARTQKAIDLYMNGWSSQLIFSGAASDKTGPSNAEVMRTQALEQGVPDSAIRIEETSETTKQNAENTKDILHDEHIKSAILVTSRYHMKRAMLEFQNRAPNISFRASPAAGDNQWSMLWWTTPYGWFLAVSELVKIIIFYLGGSR
ncbi:MAG TPA: YdcF family protein [Patescibacteria group bacterium]|nr:YdcF family protein [Patescibacteria group bacterium]